MSEPAAERARLAALVAAEGSAPPGTAGWLVGLCRTAARELPAWGVAISLMTRDGAWATAAASDTGSQAVEELQFTLGEGPCLDAFATGRPVLVPDLGADDAQRWPVYRSSVQARDVNAVFALPLQVGDARLGVMDVFRAPAGALTPSALGRALDLAELATSSLLQGQQRDGDSQTAGLGAALDGSFAVYQAQGMVMVQLQVSLAEALVRMRAYAYANDRDVGSVARDIVRRALVLERDVQ